MKCLFVCALGFVFACTSGARQEAAQLTEAMARFRKADNRSKPAMLEGLRRVPCSYDDVCAARAACLLSAEATAQSLLLKSDVEQRLVAVEDGTTAKGAAEVQELSTKLDEAKTLLEKGFAALPACDDLVLSLRRKYSL